MIYVDNRNIRRPAGWDRRAARAAYAVARLPRNQRNDAIDDRQRIWAALKPTLAKLSHRKCWYCETRQDRSHMHIDHFRPKGKVWEDSSPNSAGYWWLAFDWRNFRFVCTLCNVPARDPDTGELRGKGTHFPLRSDVMRCHLPHQPLRRERPVLLDPTCAADPGLLWFNEEGRAQSNPSKARSHWERRRVSATIDIYNLNDPALIDRRLDVVRECKRLVHWADVAWLHLDKDLAGVDKLFEEAKEQLSQRLSPQAEYSVTARATLMALRSHKRPWLDNLLD